VANTSTATTPISTRSSTVATVPNAKGVCDLSTDKPFQSSRGRILITIDSIQFYADELKCLRTKGWLNDNVVNAALHLIQFLNPDVTKFRFMSTLLYMYATNESYSSQGDWMAWSVTKSFTTAEELDACETFFMPIHVPGHWVGALVSMHSKTIELYDSLHKQRNDVLRNVLGVVEAIFKKFNKGFTPTDWRLVTSNHMIQLQTDSYNCGLFVIWNGLCLLHLNRPMRMPQNFRKTVLEWILHGSIFDFEDLEFNEL
jgi:Ulp1 family protease